MLRIFRLLFGKRRSQDTRSGRPLNEGGHKKPRIGLALSSGGARALAQVGVLEVLEAEGIEIHAIAGSSMGSYIGALWAAGFSGVQLAELAAEMNDRRKLWKLADPVIPPLTGLFHGVKAKRHLARSIGDLKFEDLERRLLVVTFDLDTCERLVIDSGSIVDAVHASCAMPGVVSPVILNGRRCSDGGVVDPVPVGALRKHANVDKVIAVSVLPSLMEVEAGCCRTPESNGRPWWRRGLGALNRHSNLMASGNIMDTFRKSIRAAQVRLAEDACRRADLCLHPPYGNARWHHYDRFQDFIEAGRKVAREHLPEIRALAEGKEPPASSHDSDEEPLVGERVA